MIKIEIKELDTFKSKGTEFENLIYDIVIAEAHRCKVAVNKIKWDDRTNIGDGGRDIIISGIEHTTDSSFFNKKDTIISIKSGVEGKSPTSMKNEILKHDKVKNCLQSGGNFIWCTCCPVDNNNGIDNLNKAREEIAKGLNTKTNQVKLCLREHLLPTINKHIGIIPYHFQKHNFELSYTLTEFKKFQHYYNDWVNTDKTINIERLISDFLDENFNSNILHITGKSGIGKTRTIIETIKNKKINNCLFFRTYEDFNRAREFKHYITRNPESIATIIIDEVSLDKFQDIVNDFYDDYSKRIKIISVGVTSRDRVKNNHPEVIYYEEPDKSEMKAIISDYFSFIEEDNVYNIIKLAENDLRLALLITRLLKEDTDYQERNLQECGLLTINFNWIFERIIKQNNDIIKDENKFREHFNKLCLFIDIGFKNEEIFELQFLADYFGKNLNDFSQIIENSKKCWLGNEKGNFFEPAPRALARLVFENESSLFIKNNLQNFLLKIPNNTLRKRFIERIQECSSTVKEDMKVALATTFLEIFPKGDLSSLFNQEKMILFKVFSETIPEFGVSWLLETLRQATKKDILSLKNTRMYIVWLCKSLSCFKEYFFDCEEILFIISQYETDNHISNNSINEWKCFFLPFLSYSEVSFLDRVSRLKMRLKNDSDRTCDILDAFKKVFLDNISRIAAPKVVGGRLVPQEKEITYNKLNKYRTEVISIISVEFYESNNQTTKDAISKFLFNNISPIIIYDKNLILRDIISTNQSISKTELYTKLDSLKRDHIVKSITKLISYIDNWIRDLYPESTLFERFEMFISRDYWIYYHSFRSDKTEQIIDEEISAFAKELLINKFDINKTNSITANLNDKLFLNKLFYFIGKLDTTNYYKSFIEFQITNNINIDLILNYINGGQKINLYESLLIENLSKFPNSIIPLLLNLKFTRNIWMIVKDFISLNSDDYRKELHVLFFQPWRDILNKDDKLIILQYHLKLLDKNSTQFLGQIAYWKDSIFNDIDLSELTNQIIFNILKNNYKYDLYSINNLIRNLNPEYTSKKIVYIIYLMKTIKVKTDYLTSSLLELANKNTSVILSTITEMIWSDKVERIYFQMISLSPIFNEFNVDDAIDWVKSNKENAKEFAFHLKSPEIFSTERNVPLLTQEFFKLFPNDDIIFQEFLRGRYSMVVYSPDAIKAKHQDLQKALKKYSSCATIWLQKWAKYEINRSKQIIENHIINDAKYFRES